VFHLGPVRRIQTRLSAAALKGGLGITSLTATCLNLLGYETPEGYDPSLVEAAR
jgi:hypothetical protein